MDTPHEHIKVSCSNGRMVVSTGRVELRILKQDGGYAHQFWSPDRKGQPHLVLSSLHKNLLVGSECRVTSHPLVSGQRPHLFEACRESLRMVYSKAEVVENDGARAVVQLDGSFLGHTLTTRITLEAGSNVVHVEVSDEFERRAIQPLVEYLMSSYAFLPGETIEEPDYLWTPILRPDDDHVIGDRAFHSPAVIVQHGRCAAALIPDLRMLSDHRPMPTSLDLDLKNGLLPSPLLSFGFCDYDTVWAARYCRHDMTMARRLNTWRLTYAFHLIVDADCERRSAHRQAARSLWKWGSLRDSKPSQEFVPQADVRSQLARLRPDAQTAFGLHVMSRQAEDSEMAAAARGMKNEILSAPQVNGLFPTRYSAQSDEWNGCWFSIDQAHYHTLECSRQALWLLEWHRLIEQDPTIVRYVRRYGDFLIRATLRSGAIPSWYTPDQTPMSPLLSGVQTAPSALLLAELAEITGFAKFLKAAERSARFVLNELVPKDVYQDYTLMDLTERTRHECADPHTHVRPQSAQAMLWVARLCLKLHELTGTAAYLKQGRDALDRVCMMQSVWKKPWVDVDDELGLIARGNVGWACDAELSAEFALCAMDYAAVTGEQEYAERAQVALSAALRAAAPRAASRVRVAAIAAIIESRFGAAYVHVSRKWVAPLNGMDVRLMGVDGRRISLSVSSGVNTRGRIVFGGMRAKTYSLQLNGRSSSRARQDLERGIGVTLSGQPREVGQPRRSDSQLSFKLP
jgi:hypothetical protein